MTLRTCIQDKKQDKEKKTSDATKKAFDIPKEGEKPKTRFAGFGASWKKKDTAKKTEIKIKSNVEVNNGICYK